MIMAFRVRRQGRSANALKSIYLAKSAVDCLIVEFCMYMKVFSKLSSESAYGKISII